MTKKTSLIPFADGDSETEKATVQQQSVRRGTVEKLVAMVRQGALKPGDKLPPERELAEQLGVGRPVVREAIRTLEGMGLLITTPVLGTHVASDGAEILRMPAQLLLLLDTPSPTDMLEVREVLEVYVAGCAAERRTEEDLAVLEECVLLMRQHEHGTPICDGAHGRFHRTIARATQNRVLERLIGYIQEARKVQNEPLRLHSRSWVMVNETHERLLDAIRRRNAADARRAMLMDMAMATEFRHFLEARAAMIDAKPNASPDIPSAEPLSVS